MRASPLIPDIYSGLVLPLLKKGNFKIMPYTEEEGGRLNNFAIEPDVYVAEPPNATEKRNYVIWGVLAMGLVGGALYVAFSVSGSV